MDTLGDEVTKAVSTARIVTVAATKGGVGKSTIAYELAATLGGVLVDLDWDTGGVTRMWGHDPGKFATIRLLDSFEAHAGGIKDFNPAPLRARRRPALVPSHPDLAASTIPANVVTECLLAWREVTTAPWIVVDTHPGANPLTDGAMAAADLVVVPVVLGGRELDALEGMLEDFADYRLLLVPNMVPASPPSRWVDRLRRAALKAQVPVTTPVSEHRWLRRRMRRAALTLEETQGAAASRAADEFRKVAARVEEACGL